MFLPIVLAEQELCTEVFIPEKVIPEKVLVKNPRMTRVIKDKYLYENFNALAKGMVSAGGGSWYKVICPEYEKFKRGACKARGTFEVTWKVEPEDKQPDESEKAERKSYMERKSYIGRRALRARRLRSTAVRFIEESSSFTT